MSEPQRLNELRRLELESTINSVFVSAITIAELMIKSSIGKLSIDFDPVDVARKSSFDLLEFNADDATLLKDLPFHHRDPFDRMLVCQALNRSWSFMTDDAQIARYGCRLL